MLISEPRDLAVAREEGRNSLFGDDSGGRENKGLVRPTQLGISVQNAHEKYAKTQSHKRLVFLGKQTSGDLSTLRENTSRHSANTNATDNAEDKQERKLVPL
jgi:hypothetical protein